MRKKFVIVGLLALFLIAALPSVAFAAARSFTATADLTQTNPGTGPMPATAADAAPYLTPVGAPFYDGLVAVLPWGDLTPGVMNLGQEFQGTLQSKVGALKGAKVVVGQNSWLTADELGNVYGVAWGSFSLSKGRGNSLTGLYGASMSGLVGFNPACATGLEVQVVDVGVWVEYPESSATGSFKKIDPTGAVSDLVVEAFGCIGEESAVAIINGTFGNDRGDRDDRGDRGDRRGGDDDDDDRGDRRGGDDDDDDRGNGRGDDGDDDGGRDNGRGRGRD
jgi:hypothetical protein